MATFADLEANVSIMKAGTTNWLLDTDNSAYTDAELIALEKTYAKEILERDLIWACNIDQEDTDDIDDIADLNEDELEEALAYLQLHLIFLNRDNGEGSASRYRAELYGKRYEEYKKRFWKIMRRNEGDSYSTSGAIEIG